MSVEFRLKYIREAIDKNINEILLKWNAKKVLLNESFDEDGRELCPACKQAGKQHFLKYCYVNLDEAVYKCESAACLYPFRNFKYKNFADRTIFRYERIMEMDGNKSSDQQMFTSPTKMESDDIDQFNISWLDDTDLDSILTGSSVGQSCDIKDIIENICNDVPPTTTTSTTPNRRANDKNTSKTPKLSKCLEYIEHLSPTKRFSQDCLPKNPSALINRMPSVSKPRSKSFKRIRNVLRKNGDAMPPLKSTIVEQQPLGILDWLDTVSRTEPMQMREFEFTSPAEYSASSKIVETTKSSATSTQQPILIELMGTSESYALEDGNQVSKSRESCLLYQLDPGEIQTTENQINPPPNAHPEEQITTEALENILSGNPNSTAPNDEHPQPFISEGNSIPTELKTIKIDLLQQNHQTSKHNVQTIQARDQPQNGTQLNVEVENAKMELEEDKKKRKLEKKELRKQEIKKRKLVEQPSKVNRKTFNIEVEEWFSGFETVEPFKTIPLRKRELVWLNLE